MEVVYHASPVQDLLVIRKHHNQYFDTPAVFATKEKEVASLFLGRLLGDFTCYPVSANGHIIIREYFKGAFNLRYGSQNGLRKGSIYHLNGARFVHLPKMWKKEVVSLSDSEPLEEERVDDVYKYINDLLDEGYINLKIADKELEELPGYKNIILDALRIEIYRQDMLKYNRKTFDKWVKMINGKEDIFW
jgi:hypothetical protein